MTHKHERQWQIHNEPMSKYPERQSLYSVFDWIWGIIVFVAAAFVFGAAVAMLLTS